MSTDVYQLCPCGSGKKLKFCCQAIAGDMEKISRLQETNQNRRAMQKLEDLARKHPANPWVVTTRAAVLLAEGHSAEAKTVLEPFVNEHPEHEFALVLYAGAVFSEDGYEAARGVVHLAFQRCPASCPEMVSGLALGVAGYMFGTGRYMAARQHLTLAMRLSADRDQQDIFLRLLELDSNRSISYPLRSVHQLSSFAGLPDDTDTQEVLRKVRRLANVGCWGTAARLMRGLTEANAESAGLWRNIGLCHAWDGEEASAAEALHQSARLESNRDTAIETEVLAQLLEMKYGPDVKESIERCWDVASASQTLTAFDRAERFEREPDDEGEESFSVGTYAVLDRPIPDSVPDTDPDLDAVPRVLANVVVLDSGQRQLEQPRVMLVGLEDEHFEECSRLVEEVLGSDAKLLTGEEAGLDQTTRGKRPAEAEPFTWNFRFPDSTSVSVVRKYNAHAWDRAIHDVWMSRPLRGLGGISPQEARGEADLDVALTASIYLLDAMADNAGYPFPLENVCRELEVEPLSPLPITDSLQVNALSSLQLQRLQVSELGDEQLSSVLNRALLVHLDRYLYEVLSEALRRPACVEVIDLNRVYSTLVGLADARCEQKEALEWVAAGREHAASLENHFEAVLQWEIRELSVRLVTPDDPQIAVLLERFRSYYLPKVPQLEQFVTDLLGRFNYPHVWVSSLTGGEGLLPGQGEPGQITAGGVWTPGSAEPNPSGQKLWMPGQQ